jgi:type I restriction enzyme S subunit
MEYIFKDVLDIKNGKNQREVECPDGQYPIYGSGGVMGYANDYICEADTVIIGRKGSINNPIYAEEPFWNVDTAFGLCAKKDILLPKYLFYFCIKFDFERLNRTVTIPSLTKSDLLKIKIQVPSLDVQQEVIDKLTKIESILNFRKQELKLLDELVRSRFVELFGNPVLNDKGWGCNLLGEITLKIGSGATPKGGREAYREEGIALIRSMNVYNGKFEYKDLAHISDEQAAKLDNANVKKSDVLLNITGASVARSCIVPNQILPARVNQHVCIVRCKKCIEPVFLNGLLVDDNYQNLLWEIAGSGATREAITKQQVEHLKIIVPPIELQNQFADFVRQIDKSKFRGLSMLTTMKSAYEQQALIYP